MIGWIILSVLFAMLMTSALVVFGLMSASSRSDRLIESLPAAPKPTGSAASRTAPGLITPISDSHPVVPHTPRPTHSTDSVVNEFPEALPLTGHRFSKAPTPPDQCDSGWQPDSLKPGLFPEIQTDNASSSDF